MTPPTARSAREGIPKAGKVSFEGRKWYQLWDEREATTGIVQAMKAAQWEKPGETGVVWVR